MEDVADAVSSAWRASLTAVGEMPVWPMALLLCMSAASLWAASPTPLPAATVAACSRGTAQATSSAAEPEPPAGSASAPPLAAPPEGAPYGRLKSATGTS